MKRQRGSAEAGGGKAATGDKKTDNLNSSLRFHSGLQLRTLTLAMLLNERLNQHQHQLTGDFYGISLCAQAPVEAVAE